MSDESVRRALTSLPVADAPPELSARLRVIASHERERQLGRFTWWERWSLSMNHLLKPLAVPAAGGLLSTALLFGAMVDTLNVQQYLAKDVPLGIYTQPTVQNLSPFGGSGSDLIVEVTLDAQGRVTDYSIPGGKMSAEQLRQVGNLILFSTFLPATAYGRPVSGKILVALRHINVRG